MILGSKLLEVNRTLILLNTSWKDSLFYDPMTPLSFTYLFFFEQTFIEHLQHAQSWRNNDTHGDTVPVLADLRVMEKACN